jgi:hypothetical protein
MGYSGTLVFLDVAWLTVLYGQKVGNPLENRPFSVADLEFEPSGVTAGLQRHSFRIWQGGAGFQDRIADFPLTFNRSEHSDWQSVIVSDIVRVADP